MEDTLTTHAARPAPAQAAGRSGARIAGIDAARAAAILGMLAIHIGPTDVDGVAGRLYAAPHGRASILFALVAGVGVTLLGRSRAGSLASARAKLLWRAAVLLPAGLALQLLDHGVYVILQDYALLFVLGLLAVGLADRLLLVLAGLSATLGPLGYLWGRIADPENFRREVVAFGEPAGEILHGLVLSGPYPLITWAAPFLVGMWLGRRDLWAPANRRRLIAVGGAVTVLAYGTSVLLVQLLGEPAGAAGWDHLVADTPHSQMPLWVIGATASAALVLGVALVATDAAGRLARPLVYTGQLALSVYVGHLLVLHTARDALTSDEVRGAALLVAAFALAAAAISTAWRSFFARGPLEALLQLPWWLAQRRTRRHRYGHRQPQAAGPRRPS